MTRAVVAALAAALVVAACAGERATLQPAPPTTTGPTLPPEPSTTVNESTTPQSTTPDPPAPAGCPTWSTVELGTATEPLREVSGLAVGQANPGLLWLHNDSGDSARVFAAGEDLTVRTEVRLPRTLPLDWEDVAIAPGPDGSPWLWLADTGDNLTFRPEVRIYRFPEPELGADPPATLEATGVEQITVTYPDGPRDVEALMVDARTGDAYLVEKALGEGNTSMMWRLPADALRDDATVEAEPVATIVTADVSQVGPTAADISADGTLVMVKNLRETFVWLRPPDTTVHDLLSITPEAECRVDAGPGEAAAFSPDGQHLYTIPEGVGQRLLRLDRS